MTYSDLPGYFDFEDVYNAQVAEFGDGAVFVELGVYHGRSLVYLAEVIRKSGKTIQLYGVDNFQDPPRGVVEANLWTCGVDRVTLIASDSAEAADHFSAGDVDFVFIDADHSYEAVARDIAAWRPKMRPGGVMAGHDRGRRGVSRAVREAFGESESVGPLSWLVRL